MPDGSRPYVGHMTGGGQDRVLELHRPARSRNGGDDQRRDVARAERQPAG
jgi:hypothetical protein